MAIIWGWVPDLMRVIFGSIFIGAVHDLTALVVSMRHRDKSIGEVAGSIINPGVKTLFFLIIFLSYGLLLRCRKYYSP